uniref:Uncharacterized protein n=1 Tax=Megaselia scalaris TaxID=36166 RepID=T1GA85_MEGSC
MNKENGPLFSRNQIVQYQRVSNSLKRKLELLMLTKLKL